MSNDLISRQAAIDAVECIVDHHSITPYQTMRAAIDHAKRIISGLPSAQPDFSCKGCQTPKHICGICMRNYPNITDHYTGGEAG